MRRLNKILLLFLAALVIFLAGVWEFLQSDFFGKSVSGNLNNLTRSQAGVSISFENLDFQFFPPGANLNNVSVEVERSEVKATAKVGRLGLYFNLLDSFKTKLSVREFYLEDAVIDVADFRKSATEREKGEEREKGSVDLRQTIRELQEPLPFTVEKALLRDVLIKVAGREQFVNMASLSASGNSLKTNFLLQNVDLTPFGFKNLQLNSIDTVGAEAVLTGNKLEVKQARVYHGLNSLIFSGTADNIFSSPRITAKGTLRAEASELHRYFDFERVGKIQKGDAAATFTFEGDLEEYRVEADAVLRDFDTSFAYGDKLEAGVAIDPRGVKARYLRLEAGEQRLSLERPFEIYSFERGRFAREPFELKAHALRFDNMLKYLESTLSPLKARLHGKVSVKFEKTGVRFYSEESVELEKLEVGFGKDPVLGAKKLKLISPEFSIVDGAFFMDTEADAGETNFKVAGRVEDGELDFVVNSGRVSLEELGPFAGMDIKGAGNFDLVARGSGGGVSLKIKTALKDFQLLGFNLEEVKANAVFDFDKSEILVEGLEGKQGKAVLTGEAKVNYSSLDILANGSLTAKRYVDVKTILEPVMGGLPVPEDIYGNWRFNFNVGGKASLEKLKASGNFSGRNNYIYNESFEYLGFKLSFADQKLKIEDILAGKAGGKIQGALGYDLGDSSTRYNFSASQIPLSEFSAYAKSPFAFDGILSGRAVGESRGKKRNMLFDMKLSNTRLAGDTYPDSGVSVALTDKELAYSANFLGEAARLDGRLMFERGPDKSIANLSLDFPDIKTPLGLLKLADKSALDASGALKFEASASFDALNYEKGDYAANLRRLELNKGGLLLDHENKGGPQIVVSNGKIRRWDIELKGKRVYLVSKGNGSLFGDYNVDNKFKIDAEILEVFNTVVSQSNGTLRARARFFGDQNKNNQNKNNQNKNNQNKKDYEALILGDSVSFGSDKLPTAVTSSDFRIVYKDKKLELEKFEASLSAGRVSGRGSLAFTGLIPDVDFTLNFKEAGFPIMKKSNVVVSGNAHLSGNNLPYSLAGEIKIQKLTLMNEITEFKREKKTVLKRDYDYLPEQAANALNNMVNMNIGVETVEPIFLDNSLADIGIVGNAQVVGGEEDFRVVGKFSLAPRNNRIFFKSNEYVLTKANIFFYERNKVSNPELDIAANSTINDHKVNIKVYGPVEDFQMELSSEPALAQEDVLSLIAFGYTEDLSANLSEREKESMTRAGAASIIFDSFKINETLKNEFGLQVNLGTEIQEERRSYLSRVNSDSSVGSVSSATTLEVKKQLNDAINLSVTSTVGGGIGQRQSMNLNYNLSDKLSVEGVYETRTSDQGEETINDSSLGADVKIRWSFR